MSSRNFRTVVFAIKFVVLFALFMGTFEASRGTAAERFLVEDFILKPTTALIRVIDPHDNVQLSGRTISSTSSKLRVTRGCEGVEILLLLAAAILAFPASWRSRAQGLGLGFLVAYALSVSRLIALHFTLRYLPNAWEALHGFALPLAPIFVTMMYFMAWSARQGVQRPPGPLPTGARV
jgi:exosortase family protein XrtM